MSRFSERFRRLLHVGRAGALSAALASLALAPAARAVNVVSQNGISYTGTVSATALGDTIGMTGNTAFPGTTTIGSFAFRGGITVGTDLWLLPTDSDEIVVVDTTTGTMTGFGLIGVGTTLNKFAGGVYDGTFIWLVPFDANGVLRVRVADGGGDSKGDVDLFNTFPAGITAGDAGKFAGGVFANGFVWFVPHNADRVVRLDPSDGSMTGFNGWPAGFTKGASAFWGGVYDNSKIWLVPFDADRIVKVDPTDGSMTEVATSHWTSDLTGYALPSRAFAGGTWDGTSVWLIPYDSDRVVSVNTSTDTMTGYGAAGDPTQWPAGFTKGATGASFNGGVYDGGAVWLVPFEATHLIRVNTTTGVMSGHTNYPAGVISSDADKWAGTGFDGTDIYLVPATRSGQNLVKVFTTTAPAVSSINRETPATSPTNADSVVFRVTFNKNVSNVDTSDFTLTVDGTAAGTIASVSASSGTTIDVTVNTITGDGNMRLDLKSSGTGIVDDFANPISGGFTTGQVYVIDNTAPVITSSLTASGTYKTAFSYTITATGSATVFGATGLPAGLSINTGTGEISGSPTAAGGPTSVTITATDAAGNVDTETLDITINTVALTVSGITANNKVYDATTTATLDTASAALVGVVAGDTVTLNTGSATGAFADKNVGTGKTVTVSGLTIGGADAANYTLTQPTTTANITTAGLTVSGVTAANRVYDGSASATPGFGSAVLVGVLGSDSVALNTSSGAGAFADKTVGTGKTVTISGLALTGTDAANYSLTQPTTTANITAKGLTVSGVTAANKVYDGTTTATLDTASAALVGVVGGDTVTLGTGSAAGTFASKTIGNGKTVTVTGLAISGADAGNYSLAQPGTTADITAKGLTVSGVTASNKTYDGTTTATLDTASAALVGVVGGDTVTLDTGSAAGAFASKTVGTGKTVTVSGLTISGADAGNYTLTQPTVTADVTAVQLVVADITASSKIYDGTTTATLDTSGASLVGLVTGDVVTLDTGSAVGTFASKTVGTGKTVTISGLTISGADAGNYTLAQPTTTADIMAKDLTVSGVTASNKVYDGNTTATLDTASAALVGAASGDTVTLDASAASGVFADAAVGSGKTVTVSGLALAGADADNYTLTQPTTTANITAASATVTLGSLSHTYDGSAKSATASTTPSGLAVSITYNGSSTAPTDAGSYAVVATVTNANYTGSDSGTLVIAKASATVTISNTAQIYDGAPKPVTVTTNPPDLTVDVTYNGSATVPSAIGSYTVIATVNSANYTGSASATLVISKNSRLSNLSSRAHVGTGDDIIIPGFVITGSGTKRVLIRGVGPELSTFGVSGALEAPTITLKGASGDIATNTGWATASNADEIEQVTNRVGAFLLPRPSPDSALLATLAPGAYTVHLSGVGGTTGIGIVEIYDVDEGTPSARLVNISARARVGLGAEILIPGFVLDGTGSRRLLIRAVGPGLAQFGVSGLLADPQITIFQGSAQVGVGNDWSDENNSAEIETVTNQIGAFPLDAGSKDAAVLVTLEPGAFTVQITGVGDTTGVALVEIFEVE